jgi:hypothetical protein
MDVIWGHCMGEDNDWHEGGRRAGETLIKGRKISELRSLAAVSTVELESPSVRGGRSLRYWNERTEVLHVVSPSFQLFGKFLKDL